ncbi:MAG: hypothetical protein ABWZ25_04370 [Chitinophagaceae bacterium]
MATNKKPKEEPPTSIEMPDVSDIPGQEHVHPLRFREMEDTTISSSDEEGDGLLDELNGDDDEPLTDGINDLGVEERKALRRSGQIVNAETKDMDELRLDRTDGEDLLNESSNPLDYGEDLDVPGSELDDSDEELGEEDEENNAYSNPDL